MKGRTPWRRRCLGWSGVLLSLGLSLLSLSQLPQSLWQLAPRQRPLSSLLRATLPGEADVRRGWVTLQDLFGVLQDVQLTVHAAPGADVASGNFLARLQQLRDALAALPGVAHVLGPGELPLIRLDAQGQVLTQSFAESLPPTGELAARRAFLQAQPLLLDPWIATDLSAATLVCVLQASATPAVLQAMQAVAVAHFPLAQLGLLGAPVVLNALLTQLNQSFLWLLPLVLGGGVLGLAYCLKKTRRLLAVLLPCCLLLLPCCLLDAWWSSRGMPELTYSWCMRRLLHAWAVGTGSLTLQVQMVLGDASAATRRRVAWGGGITTLFWAALACGLPAETQFGLDYAWLAGCSALALGVALLCVPAFLSGSGADAAPHAAPHAFGMPPWRQAITHLALLLLVCAAAAQLPKLGNAPTPPAAQLVDDVWLRQAQHTISASFGSETVWFVALQSDWSQPHLLRRLAMLTEDISALPGVQRVQSILDALREAHVVMEGSRSLPVTAAQTRALLGIILSEPLAQQLLDASAQHALLIVHSHGETRLLQTRLNALLDAAQGSYSAAAAAQPPSMTLRQATRQRAADALRHQAHRWWGDAPPQPSHATTTPHTGGDANDAWAAALAELPPAALLQENLAAALFAPVQALLQQTVHPAETTTHPLDAALADAARQLAARGAARSAPQLQNMGRRAGWPGALWRQAATRAELALQLHNLAEFTQRQVRTQTWLTLHHLPTTPPAWRDAVEEALQEAPRTDLTPLRRLQTDTAAATPSTPLTAQLFSEPLLAQQITQQLLQRWWRSGEACWLTLSGMWLAASLLRRGLPKKFSSLKPLLYRLWMIPFCSVLLLYGGLAASGMALTPLNTALLPWFVAQALLASSAAPAATAWQLQATVLALLGLASLLAGPAPLHSAVLTLLLAQLCLLGVKTILSRTAKIA